MTGSSVSCNGRQDQGATKADVHPWTEGGYTKKEWRAAGRMLRDPEFRAEYAALKRQGKDPVEILRRHRRGDI